MKLVNPANKRKFDVIVVGTGLAGASAAAIAGRAGLQRASVFTYQDSPRRAHSIAAQGGINAAKNYQNDGDSIYRLFYDTVKGGDFRSPRGQRLPAGPGQREHHRPVRGAGRALRPRVRRHCWPTAPSAARRSPAPSTPAARPASSCCSAPIRRSCAPDRRPARCTMYNRTEMLDLVVIDGVARGIVTRDLVTGEIESHVGRRRGAGHRRIRQRVLPVDQRHGVQRHRDLAGPPAGARSSPTRASRRSTPRASRPATSTSRS